MTQEQELRHQLELDINTGRYNHLSTECLMDYLAEINRSMGGHNPAYHEKRKLAAEAIRFELQSRETARRDRINLKWTKIAAITSILTVIAAVATIIIMLANN